jgi:hypothetical protein
MYRRHEQILRLSAWPTRVEAKLFNLALRALGRAGGPVVLPMRGLKSLELIVQPEAWIIVDRSMNDLPIAAWTDFEADATRGLHQPVTCELRYYHGHAGVVIKKVLRRMEEGLGALLTEGEAAADGAPARVIAFPGRPAEGEGGPGR